MSNNIFGRDQDGDTDTDDQVLFIMEIMGTASTVLPTDLDGDGNDTAFDLIFYPRLFDAR